MCFRCLGSVVAAMAAQNVHQTLNGLSPVVKVPQVDVGGEFEGIDPGRLELMEALFVHFPLDVLEHLGKQLRLRVVAGCLPAAGAVAVVDVTGDSGRVFKVVDKERRDLSVAIPRTARHDERLMHRGGPGMAGGHSQNEARIVFGLCSLCLLSFVPVVVCLACFGRMFL